MFSLTRRLATLIFLLTAYCFADTLAAVPVSGAAGRDPNVPSFVLGWEFTTSTTLNITGLAYLDATGAGLRESHQVSLFNMDTQAVLLSAVVPAGTGATYKNGFRVVPASFSLPPGRYVIGGLRVTDADAVIVRATSLVSIPQVTYVGERESASAVMVLPGNLADGRNEIGSFGPSFTVADSNTKTITGVVNSGSFQPAFASGTYLSIFGTGLASTTRTWGPSDFGGGVNAPTSLDGVSVTVGGLPAYVEYVSSTQLNIVTPNNLQVGDGVQIVVKYPGQPDVSAWVTIAAAAPGFFPWPIESNKYLVAQHANFTNVGRVGLFPGQAANFTTPAKPGETIVLYGTGLGTTGAPAGQLADKAYPVTPLPTATFGNLAAQVSYAGVVPSLAQIYQVNLVVPANIPDGDWPVTVTVNGVTSASGLITVAR